MTDQPEPVQPDPHPDADRATEPDEEQILHGLYGAPDTNGHYRGQPADQEVT